MGDVVKQETLSAVLADAKLDYAAPANGDIIMPMGHPRLPWSNLYAPISGAFF